MRIKNLYKESLITFLLLIAFVLSVLKLLSVIDMNLVISTKIVDERFYLFYQNRTLLSSVLFGRTLQMMGDKNKLIVWYIIPILGLLLAANTNFKLLIGELKRRFGMLINKKTDRSSGRS
ncbi:MAG: hypothetical protein QG570_733 [Patescibacteria group bacterium]|nr:hypothetical protein [Patescibacteria group bacterium]